MVGLYFGGEWFLSQFGNEFGNIELDAALDETHEWSAEATMFPVEDGAPVTDHIIEQPDKLRLRGFVSETPIGSAALVVPVGGSRSRGVFELLEKLIKLRATMTVYTRHKNYADMALVGVNIPRSASVGEAIEFTAEFVRIRKVATQLVDIPPGINPKPGKTSAAVAKKAQPAKDAGKKQAAPVERPSSTLRRLTASAGG